MKRKILTALALSLMLCSCEDYLTRLPQDTVTDTPDFWNNEKNVRSEAIGLYDHYFDGYKTGWSRSTWFAETDIADWVDDNAQRAATFFTKVAPASGGGWDFTTLRRINVIIDRVTTNSMEEEVKNHWLGVGRFFRALEYCKLVSKFGDVPYYDTVLSSTDYEKLYAPRMKRSEVMDRVLADFKFACEHVRAQDGEPGLSVNNDVVLAYMSRAMLFEGTWQKYREKDAQKAAEYLKAAKDAAEKIIKSRNYSLHPNYKELTTSLDLAGNKEIILYRSYVEGELTHSLMSFQNTEHENSSPSRSLIESYLSSNGLPINQPGNTLYDKEKEKWFETEFANRDPRLSQIIYTDDLYLEGVKAPYAVSGYFANRFVNEDIKTLPAGTSSTNTTDAPVMKLNEVMMNYIEAAAELQELGQYTLTQDDVDMTINTIRDRESTRMPHLTLSGNGFSVNGTVINDPERDQDVPSLIWEIRRERRTELVYEGIRFNDLRRWSKLNYADMKLNKKLNLGAWLDKDKYIAWYNKKHPESPITMEHLKSVTLDRSGNAGYIMPIQEEAKMRTFSEKDYLYPIPEDQITLYEQNNKPLNQNPGW